MSADPFLWDHVTAYTGARIDEFTEDLESDSERDRIDDFISACKSLAHFQAVSQDGGECVETEDLSHWNHLYATIIQSLIPSFDESAPTPISSCSCSAEYLDFELASLKSITEKFIAADPSWMNGIARSFKTAATAARETTCGALLRYVEDLRILCEGPCSYERDRSDKLSKAAREFTSRISKIKGPAVKLDTTGSRDHILLRHEDAADLVYDMSDALQSTLNSLDASTWLHPWDVNKIRNSVIAIQRQTSNILSADLEITEIGDDHYPGETEQIEISQEEYDQACRLWPGSVARDTAAEVDVNE